MRKLLISQFFPNGLPFEVHQGHYEWGYPDHTHDFHELVLFTGGKGRHALDEKVRIVSPGDLFVLRGNTSHGVRAACSLDFYNLLFLPRETQEFLTDLSGMPGFQALFVIQAAESGARRDASPNLQLDSRSLAQAVQVLEQMREEIESDRPGRLVMARALFQTLVVLLSREYERQAPPDWHCRRMSEAVAWLERHYLEDIRIDDLARRASYTVRHFGREFRKIYGTSPIDRVLGLRLDHAAGLLQETDLSVAEIASQSGFRDSNYFSRQFRRRFNLSPREFRQRLT